MTEFKNYIIIEYPLLTGYTYLSKKTFNGLDDGYLISDSLTMFNVSNSEHGDKNGVRY